MLSALKYFMVCVQGVVMFKTMIDLLIGVVISLEGVLYIGMLLPMPPPFHSSLSFDFLNSGQNIEL